MSELKFYSSERWSELKDEFWKGKERKRMDWDQFLTCKLVKLEQSNAELKKKLIEACEIIKDSHFKDEVNYKWALATIQAQEATTKEGDGV